MGRACGIDCQACPALARCGATSNFCVVSTHRARTDGCGGCGYCPDGPLSRMDVRRQVMEHLDGLDLSWPEHTRHPGIPELPLHLPILVQAYADVVDLPWVALHGGRVFGSTGRALTHKHRRPLRETYRLSPDTKVALEFYVEDRVLEGIWATRRTFIQDLRSLELDLILAPNLSVWSSHPRFESLVQQRRANLLHQEMAAAGLPVVPDIGFSLFEPDGRVWADWVNTQTGLQAVSLFCGGRKVHADKRAHRESVEDVALFHEAVRPEVAFVIGGVHALTRLADYRQAAPGRRLCFCNGMAYSVAQRRRLIGERKAPLLARSSHACFSRNARYNDRAYAQVLDGGSELAV